MKEELLTPNQLIKEMWSFEKILRKGLKELKGATPREIAWYIENEQPYPADLVIHGLLFDKHLPNKASEHFVGYLEMALRHIQEFKSGERCIKGKNPKPENEKIGFELLEYLDLEPVIASVTAKFLHYIEVGNPACLDYCEYYLSGYIEQLKKAK